MRSICIIPSLFCKKLSKIFVLSLLFVSIFARAEIVSVGPHQISIPLPSGHCLLDETNPNHKGVIELVRESLEAAKNIFLFQSADCDNLAEWLRGDGPLVDAGTAAASLTAANHKISDMSDEEILLKYRKTWVELGAEKIDKHIGNVTEKDRQVPNWAKDKGSKYHSPKKYSASLDRREFLGIVGEDEYALYLGYSTNISSQPFGLVKRLSIRAFTLVDGKIVFLDLSTNNKHPDALLQLLTGVKEWIGRVQREN